MMFRNIHLIILPNQDIELQSRMSERSSDISQAFPPASPNNPASVSKPNVREPVVFVTAAPRPRTPTARASADCNCVAVPADKILPLFPAARTRAPDPPPIASPTLVPPIIRLALWTSDTVPSGLAYRCSAGLAPGTTPSKVHNTPSIAPFANSPRTLSSGNSDIRNPRGSRKRIGLEPAYRNIFGPSTIPNGSGFIHRPVAGLRYRNGA